MELQHQVRESISALSVEQQARVDRHEEQQRMSSEFGLPPALDTMTEDEAVAFALMLSAEEQERQILERSREETVVFRLGGFVSDGHPVDPFGLRGAVGVELAQGVEGGLRRLLRLLQDRPLLAQGEAGPFDERLDLAVSVGGRITFGQELDATLRATAPPADDALRDDAAVPRHHRERGQG